MPTCFVVMGFGKKTDPDQKKTFDLDKSYKYIIKPAVEAAGYSCQRADEIQHAGNINVPMYEQLFEADLVIADLSTANIDEQSAENAQEPAGACLGQKVKLSQGVRFGLAVRLAVAGAWPAFALLPCGRVALGPR